MEFVFIFFVIILPVLIIGGLGTAIYRHDPLGWNQTLKRISRVSRANLEAKKEVPVLEPVKKLEDKTAAQWEAEFNGKPIALEPTKLKHEIVKTDYEKSSLGYWPRWHCKCGASDSTPVIGGLGGIKEAEKKALLRGKNHVDAMNEAEEKMRKSGGKFAF